MGDPSSSPADRRFLLTDVHPSSQTPARARTRLTGDGAPSGDGLDFRRDADRGRRGAAAAWRGTSHSRKTRDHRRARRQERARGGRYPLPLGRNVADHRLRLLRARSLGLWAGRHRRTAQLVRALEHGSRRWSPRGWPQETCSCSPVSGTWVSISEADAWCMRHRPGETSRSWTREHELRFSSRRCATSRSRVFNLRDDDARVRVPRARRRIPYRRPAGLRGSPLPHHPLLSTRIPEASEEREDDEHDDQDQEPGWHVFTSWRL